MYYDNNGRISTFSIKGGPIFFSCNTRDTFSLTNKFATFFEDRLATFFLF